ncbi:Na+-transporting methylmalonyl-CoA/oxaloacetate decarboxylase%2C gamma subunit [uncultured Ruminococcus sp.]|uniref:OadG family transporter subunit n=1 Tax=uncultured Ruminococcus sp. TaxID=165186 RepID=UPI000821F22A|nr:OadG family transporter subunit [uncultured Ruminococcus sp.]SCI23225.1 Na+-transporting methylmalonyl-CoA/oxaloacetate decarboxylase%2C gamma subunit [uncultured Ruminococcus sp.]SCJ31379.1 Na+-transporting methylmalonyl-CoA/oxaloacetate decarboxylase%2C gamma subunit [uncultured Ruminococcus sp.]
MINFLNTAAQIVAAKSTISPDQKDLGAGTVASVVITGIVVVFIGLVLLILLVSIYGKIFDVINSRAARKAEEAKKAAEAAKAVAKPEPIMAVAPVVEDGIEEETVAVIMAAISAMSSAEGKKLVLKSVKTAKPQRPAWSTAGIIDNTRPF